MPYKSLRFFHKELKYFLPKSTSSKIIKLFLVSFLFEYFRLKYSSLKSEISQFSSRRLIVSSFFSKLLGCKNFQSIEILFDFLSFGVKKYSLARYAMRFSSIASFFAIWWLKITFL